MKHVQDVSKYPISSDLISVSRGGTLPDKKAISDGIGTILIKSVTLHDQSYSNKTYNKLLFDNKKDIIDNDKSLDTLITDGIITLDTKTDDEINKDNLLVDDGTTFICSNSTDILDVNKCYTTSSSLCTDGTYDSNTKICNNNSLNFIKLSLGYENTCGIDTNGDTYCWGYNIHGQLGLGNTINQLTPQKLSRKFSSLSLSGDHTCGIEQETGDTYCWGYNSDGGLGIGNTTNQSTLQKLSRKFTKIFLRGSHTCGIDTNGDTYCWGSNYYRQLGLGNNTNYNTPQKVQGSSTLISCPTGYTLDDSDISNVRCYQDAIQ